MFSKQHTQLLDLLQASHMYLEYKHVTSLDFQFTLTKSQSFVLTNLQYHKHLGLLLLEATLLCNGMLPALTDHQSLVTELLFRHQFLPMLNS